MTQKLASKTAIITGAAQGIGAAIARAFVQEGGFVYVTDINDELGRRVAQGLGEQACYLRLDVRSEDDWQRVTDRALLERGRLDVLVNNAGITGFEHGAVAHDPENASLADWQAVHRTNLDGGFLG
jgi:NAD(P)-dependent dehydrogenase (short-subunit alcohol dehydrogenase family)